MADRGRRFISSHEHPEISAFPASPALGTPAFKGGVMYIYATFQGITTWFPLNKPQSSYVHNQGLEALTWTINHKLASKDVIVGVYNLNNDVIDAAITHSDATGEWVTTITFTSVTAGYAVIFGQESLSAPLLEAVDLAVSNSIKLGGVDIATQTDLVNGLAPKLDTVSYTAADILAKLLTVDGIGSGLDADMLDGNSAAFFAPQSDTNTKAEVQALIDGVISSRIWKGSVATFADLATAYPTPLESWTAAVNDEDVIYRYDGVAWIAIGNGIVPLASSVIDGKMSIAHFNKLTGIETAATADQTPVEILAAMLTVDGAGSGLDADLLGGVPSIEYLTTSSTIDLGTV